MSKKQFSDKELYESPVIRSSNLMAASFICSSNELLQGNFEDYYGEELSASIED